MTIDKIGVSGVGRGIPVAEGHLEGHPTVSKVYTPLLMSNMVIV